MIQPASPPPDEGPARSGPRPDERRARAATELPERSFAHASEAEMSRILDFYGVTWRYEPTTFPILWNIEGEVVESFSPDFYLPDFDLYLEMTTLKQSLVRKKNRKLRRLRELYPDIRIKLFYARDFRAMMLKYGRLGLAESLTGTSGQLVGGIPAGEAQPLDRGEPAATAVSEVPMPAPSAAAAAVPSPAAPGARRRRARRARSGADVEIA